MPAIWDARMRATYVAHVHKHVDGESGIMKEWTIFPACIIQLWMVNMSQLLYAAA